MTASHRRPAGAVLAAAVALCVAAGCGTPSSGGALLSTDTRQPGISVQPWSTRVVAPPPSPATSGPAAGARSAAPARLPGRAGVAPGAPDPARVPLGDPATVGRAFVVAANSADTALDGGPEDALIRAAALMTPAYAAAVKAGRITSAPGGAWNTAATHRGYAVCTAVINPTDPQPRTATSAALSWTVTCSWHGRRPASWRAPAGPALLGGTFFLHLVAGPDRRWHVAAMINGGGSR